MKHEFTVTVVERYIKKAADNFYKSNRPRKEKKQLKELLPFIFIRLTESLKETWGQVYLVPVFDKRVEKYQIDTDAYRLEPLDNFYHIVVDLNRRVLQWSKPQDCFNIIAHELAHCLDCCYRLRIKHDKFWRAIAIAMGGNGHTLADIDIPDYVFEKNFLKKKDLRKGYYDSY